jgi:hypothetical protein
MNQSINQWGVKLGWVKILSDFRVRPTSGSMTSTMTSNILNSHQNRKLAAFPFFVFFFGVGKKKSLASDVAIVAGGLPSIASGTGSGTGEYCSVCSVEESPGVPSDASLFAEVLELCSTSSIPGVDS